MKKVLLASTALVMSAGFAAADVSVGGDGRMGVIVDEGADMAFTSRIRISFSASGETDLGLAFGGSVRADNSGGGAAGTAGSVFVEGTFGKISMGDVSGAVEAAVGDLSGVGLTGLGDANELTYLSNADRPAARWDYVTGDLGVHVSADNPGATATPGDAYSVAVTYSTGGFAFGLGWETSEDAAGLGVSADHIVAGVTASLGDATIKAVYGTADDVDFDQYGVSIDYVTGATTLTAFYIDRDTSTAALATALGSSLDGVYGVGVSYDLGGGAAIKGGYVDGDNFADASYDFGISMSF